MKIHLEVASDRIGLFYELLSTGILIRTKTNRSIRQLLCEDLCIDPIYVDTRIQTIFLNGRAIDDIDSTVVHDGSILALSGAMPGLAGAVFRKGGIFAPLRSVFETAPKHQTILASDGSMVLKMFNQVAVDLGPIFFKRGICVKGKTFRRFWDQRSEDLKKICSSIEIDGKKYPAGEGVPVSVDPDEVWLSIDTV